MCPCLAFRTFSHFTFTFSFSKTIRIPSYFTSLPRSHNQTSIDLLLLTTWPSTTSRVSPLHTNNNIRSEKHVSWGLDFSMLRQPPCFLSHSHFFGNKAKSREKSGRFTYFMLIFTISYLYSSFFFASEIFVLRFSGCLSFGYCVWNQCTENTNPYAMIYHYDQY